MANVIGILAAAIFAVTVAWLLCRPWGGDTTPSTTERHLRIAGIRCVIQPHPRLGDITYVLTGSTRDASRIAKHLARDASIASAELIGTDQRTIEIRRH